ncbi:MAG TPA: type II secretion system F family protein [Syntrophomonadaceae bacterium]|nr:type II secretion system F family protein [Syntrophomonadaceae bacterium]
MEPILCTAVFLLVVFLVVAVLKSLFKRDLYQQRLNQLTAAENPGSVKHLSSSGSISLLEKLSKLLASRSLFEKIQAELIRAGLPLKAHEYIGLCTLVILVLPVVLYALTSNFWLAVIAVIVGMLVPGFYLKRKKESRLQALNQQLGDSLVIMANALRAGFGFQQAMGTVRKEMPPPISTEFSWTLREMNLGVSQEEALLNLGRRAMSDDLDIVITGILIQRQVGGNLAEILENISQTIRERNRIKREIHTLTAQGRMSGMIIGGLPLLLIGAMLILNPSYVSIMVKDTRGIILLLVGAIMEILGILVMKKLINFDY